MTPLQARLVERIRTQGPVTFRDFMEAALYDPDHGYYATGRPWQGDGDFVTAPRFGDGLARAFAALAGRARAAMGPGSFEVVEVGAGSGALAAQLAPLLRAQGIGSRAVEVRRPPLLPPGFSWAPRLEDLGPVRGMFVSNELFDALPVHLVAGTEEGAREVWVATEGNRLVAQPGPLSGSVADHLRTFGGDPAPGEVVEVGLDTCSMMRAMGRTLEAGVVLTVDYGDTATGLRARPQGTLVATRAHRIAPDPLADPGLQDLTAHVNFDALEAAAREEGLQTLARVPQWQFLAATGALDGIGEQLAHPDTLAEGLAAKALLAPGRMGDFHVLAMAKGLAPTARDALRGAFQLPATPTSPRTLTPRSRSGQDPSLL